MTTKPKRKEKPIGGLNLPPSIKIGGKDFYIEHVDKLVIEGDNCLGAYTDDCRLVRLHKSITKDPWHELEIFIHEAIGHGLWSFFSLPEEEGDKAEEKFSEVISKGLTMILRDNPELVKAIYDIQRT